MMEIDENGEHQPNWDYLLSDEVLDVIKDLKYTHRETVVDSSRLRDLIIAKYAEEGKAGIGKEVAASLIMWYFEHVVKYKGVEEELNEVEDKVDRVMEMAEENKARIEAVQQNVDSMRLEILEALRNIQLDIAAR